MKAVYIIGILLFMLATVSSASALTLTETNIESGSIPTGATVKIDVTYGTDTITFVDRSTGLTDPRITWVAYNLDVDKEWIKGYGISTENDPVWQEVPWSEKQNFGAGGIFGELSRVYAVKNPGSNQFTTVQVKLQNFGGIIPGNIYGNQVGVHFVCGQFSGFVSGSEPEEPPTPDTPIPEFPSMVLPVAAVLGLLFISQRRKEN